MRQDDGPSDSHRITHTAAFAQRPGQHQHQRRGAAGVCQCGYKRPAQYHVRQAADQLPHCEPGDPSRLTPQRALAQPPRQHAERWQQGISHQPVDIVNRSEGREVEVLTAAGLAQLAPELEALAKVHDRPEAPLAAREFGAGQHCIVGADPAAQRHLQPQHGEGSDQPAVAAGGQRRRAGSALGLRIPHRLQAQQRQQHQPAHEVQCDDGGEQFHRHRERAERALDTDPGQRERRPPGADRQRITTPQEPSRRSECENQNADTGGEVAVDHLDPGLAVGHRSSRHGGLGLSDLGLGSGAQRAGGAVAAGPIRATQARIRQTGEGAEQHQIEGQEQRQQCQRLQAPGWRVAPAAQPQPSQRAKRQHDAHEHQAQSRRQVEQRRGFHQFGEPPLGLAEAGSAPSEGSEVHEVTSVGVISAGGPAGPRRPSHASGVRGHA